MHFIKNHQIVILNLILNSYFLILNYLSFVRKGEAGNPSLLYKLASAGLSAHAYRTATGSETALLQTIT